MSKCNEQSLLIYQLYFAHL